MRLMPIGVILLVLLVAAPERAVAQPANTDTLSTDRGPLIVHAISHASFLMQWNGLVVAVDPIDDATRFLSFGHPNLVLVTHRHGDHFDPVVLTAVAGENTVVITPQDVAESVPAMDTVPLANGGSHTAFGVTVTAVAAYNRTADRLEFHPRGRDNGYLVEAAGTRVYISGDTEDIAEQAGLGRIDAAFLCMNLPWTMSLEQAARAVRTIRPTVLYPYHYRNHGGGLTDVGRLPELLGPEFNVDIRVLAWY